MAHEKSEHLHVMEIDLAREESRRRAEVIAALGDAWDPVEALEGEEAAYRLLYSGLDEEQTAVYRRLVAGGVLPPREGDDRAAD
jgi:hypothetical protein